jgi:hypothetical protein
VKELFRWRVLAPLINATALVAVLSFVGKGVAVARLRPVAGFLLLSTAAAVYANAGARLLARRARRQMEAELPRGVRLRKPLWMSAIEAAAGFGPIATIAAVVALFGRPDVGLGILLTVLVVFGAIHYVAEGFSAQSLAFEDRGLRVHVRGASFLIPWSGISRLDRQGPETHRLTYLHIVDPKNVIGSVNPDTPQSRKRAMYVTYGDGPPGGKLMLAPWIGGIDDTVLARAINAALSGNRSTPN